MHTLIENADTGKIVYYIHIMWIHSRKELFEPASNADLKPIVASGTRMTQVGTNMTSFSSASAFLDAYWTFNEEYGNYRRTNPRYGIAFDLMLPKGEWSQKALKKLSTAFAKKMAGEEKGLKYISWTYTVGLKDQVKILRLWIADRELYLHKPKYKKNFYVDAFGVPCSPATEGAVLKCKKGDDIPNRAPIQFKETKTRRFEWKPGEFENFRDYVGDIWIQAIRSATEAKILRGRSFHRLKLNDAKNRWLRRVIIANNKARQFIQHELNYWIGVIKGTAPPGFDDWVLEATTGEPVEMAGRSKELTALNELFTKYQQIFRKNRFTIQDTEYLLTKVKCNESEHNCCLLIEEFKKDLKEIRNAYNICEKGEVL